MKKILIPLTARPHFARMQPLIDELQKNFEVDVWIPKEEKGGMAISAIFYAIQFNNYLSDKHYDAVIIRADRYELLFLASICAFKEIPIVHIEGGADSGSRVIDTKVRDAISQLAEIHLVTDPSAQRRLFFLGASPDKVFDVGSFDVSYANSITPKRIIDGDYILCLFHSIPNEDEKTFYEIVKEFEPNYKIVGIKSNSDYQESISKEEYSPEEFISLMYYANCIVGNSSSLCKESSILGTPSVLVGRRQNGRVVGRNVMRVPFDRYEIKKAIEYKLNHKRYEPDLVYFQPNMEENACKILKELI